MALFVNNGTNNYASGGADYDALVARIEELESNAQATEEAINAIEDDIQDVVHESSMQNVVTNSDTLFKIVDYQMTPKRMGANTFQEFKDTVDIPSGYAPAGIVEVGTSGTGLRVCNFELISYTSEPGVVRIRLILANNTSTDWGDMAPRVTVLYVPEGMIDSSYVIL